MNHVPLQPNKEMLDAGVEELLQSIPGVEDEVDDALLQDTVCFIWQAMRGAYMKNSVEHDKK